MKAWSSRNQRVESSSRNFWKSPVREANVITSEGPSMIAWVEMIIDGQKSPNKRIVKSVASSALVRNVALERPSHQSSNATYVHTDMVRYYEEKQSQRRMTWSIAD